MGHLTGIVLGLALMVAPLTVLGHGFMFEPKARNVIQDNGDAGSCTSGGPYEVSGHNTLTWPAGNRDVCGGSFTPTAPMKTYAAGSVITISLLLTAQHGGRHMFRLCDRTSADEACLAANVLQRADGQGPFTWTPTEPAKGNSIPASAYSQGSVQGGSDAYDGEIYSMQYRLPAGVTCSACTLQWWWTTANSCSLPGNPFGDNGMDACTTPQPGPYPEEFTNCAEVAITGAGGVAPAQPAPATTPAVQPTPVEQPEPTRTPTPAAPATPTVPAAKPTHAHPTQPGPTPAQPVAPSTEPAAPVFQPSPAAGAPSYPRKMAAGRGNGGCADAACVCQAEGVGTWEAPWSCSQYVMCGPGTADAMPCADGTLWDSAAVTCNTAAQVNCAGRP
ncbi:hypothetical protein N2152v2_007394 [Parachlorella kessleri]